MWWWLQKLRLLWLQPWFLQYGAGGGVGGAKVG